MAYRRLNTISRRAQQEELDLNHPNKEIFVQYREENQQPKRADQIKKFLKDALLKVLGKEDLEETQRLPKNHLNIRMLHINKVVTKK